MGPVEVFAERPAADLDGASPAIHAVDCRNTFEKFLIVYRPADNS